MTLHLAAGLVASVVLAAGLLLTKGRGSALPHAHGRFFLRAIVTWIKDPVWMLGLALQTAGYALYVWALEGSPVSLLSVVMQCGIGLFVTLAVLFLGERARPLEWVALAGLFAATLMLVWSVGTNEPRSRVNPSLLTLVSIVSVVAAAATAASPRLAQSGMSAAVVSGIAFGLGSLYTKGLADELATAGGLALVARAALDPYVYLTIGANIAGLVMLQNSFHRMRGMIAMPVSSALSNVVPILGGIVAFGEHLPPQPLAASLRIAAFVLTIVAGALLSATRDRTGPAIAS